MDELLYKEIDYDRKLNIDSRDYMHKISLILVAVMGLSINFSEKFETRFLLISLFTGFITLSFAFLGIGFSFTHERRLSQQTKEIIVRKDLKNREYHDQIIEFINGFRGWAYRSYFFTCLYLIYLILGFVALNIPSQGFVRNAWDFFFSDNKSLIIALVLFGVIIFFIAESFIRSKNKELDRFKKTRIHE